MKQKDLEKKLKINGFKKKLKKDKYYGKEHYEHKERNQKLPR